MSRMKMETPNMTTSNIERIEALFPNCITETKDANGRLKKAVNFELLRQMLSEDVVEGNEAYEFTWVGKKAAIVEANRPIRKTLRPCPKESVDWDTTENLYIEGDNLEVLKLLQESYLGKIKMIYIDPPYNTGNDHFIFNDSFLMDQKDYEEAVELFDEDNNRLFRENDKSNPKFHSDWDSMIYARLLLTRNLLTDDGVIFLSIGQHEIHALIAICNEIFGEANRCGIISRLMKSGGAKGRFFSPNIEYILVYAKNINKTANFRETVSGEIIKKLYTAIENSGKRKGEAYRPFGLYQSSLAARPNQRYYIQCPDGTLVIPPGDSMPSSSEDGALAEPKVTDGCWRWSRDRYLEERAEGNIDFKQSKAGVLITSEGKPANWNVYSKIWLKDRQEEGMVPVDLIIKWENRLGTKELGELRIPFDFSKPSALIQYLLGIIDINSGDIVLDFFSGSATTAHAVMQLNAEWIKSGASENDQESAEGKQSKAGTIKYIMVQLPESCDEKSEAFKAGYKNICEIGKERIRRAGKQIKEKDPLLLGNLDTGFRVLKLDDTNMNDVYYAPGDYSRELLEQAEDNIKDDRTDLDLLFGCLLDWGVTLSDPYESIQIEGHTVHNYNDGDLIACFDKNVPESVIKKIAKMNPERVVFRESCFKDSAAKINVEQIFKMLAPDMDVEKNLKII